MKRVVRKLIKLSMRRQRGICQVSFTNRQRQRERASELEREGTYKLCKGLSGIWALCSTIIIIIMALIA